MNASTPHEQAMIDLLRQDPDFADEYINAALDAVNEPGGEQALLSALRVVALAQGVALVAERAGMPQDRLDRALRPSAHPTFRTLRCILAATGMTLAVRRQPGVRSD
jgi:probable addiction module antidote protein